MIHGPPWLHFEPFNLMPGSGFAFRQKFEEHRWSNPDRQAGPEMHVQHKKNLSWQKAYPEQADHPALNLRHSFLALQFYNKKKTVNLTHVIDNQLHPPLTPFKNSTRHTETFVSTRI
jgi:hypothetical protein